MSETLKVQAGAVALLESTTSQFFDDRDALVDLQPESFSWGDHHTTLVRPTRRRARPALAMATLTAAAWAPVAAAAPPGNQRRGVSLQTQPLAGSCAKALVGVAAQRTAPWWRAPVQDQQSSTAAQRHEVHGDSQQLQSTCAPDAGSAAPGARKPPATQRQQQRPLQRAASSGASPLQSLSAALSETLQPVKLLFAGAMSAVVSRTAMAPLERVKMDQLLSVTPSTAGVGQAMLQVYHKEGIGGFWRGNALNLLRTAPFKVWWMEQCVGRYQELVLMQRIRHRCSRPQADATDVFGYHALAAAPVIPFIVTTAAIACLHVHRR